MVHFYEFALNINIREEILVKTNYRGKVVQKYGQISYPMLYQCSARSRVTGVRNKEVRGKRKSELTEEVPM